ncbi:MAG: cytochrome c oxidase subunit 3 [Flavobacteriales bacterium]|nr:cytochrome c oxidase subunit 3 [Flavobacteriales bacterium]
MDDVFIKEKEGDIYYPPGGILIWFLIILELFTFLGAILIFVYYRKNMLKEFTESKAFLNPIIGTINTIVLITSGYFMAISIHKLRANDNQKSAFFMLIGTLLGIIFLGIKGLEFYHKIELGIGFNYNTFFTFYWLMTGFHFIHVLFGVGLLSYMYFAVKNRKYSVKEMFDVEASAAYWHMCDLIWILIFPILYLI